MNWPDTADQTSVESRTAWTGSCLCQQGNFLAKRSSKVFIPAWTLEDYDNVPLNMLETQEYMHKHRMQKRRDKEKPVKEKDAQRNLSLEGLCFKWGSTNTGWHIDHNVQSVKLKHNGMWEWGIYGLKSYGKVSYCSGGSRILQIGAPVCECV